MFDDAPKGLDAPLPLLVAPKEGAELKGLLGAPKGLPEGVEDKEGAPKGLEDVDDDEADGLPKGLATLVEGVLPKGLFWLDMVCVEPKGLVDAVEPLEVGGKTEGVALKVAVKGFG